MQASVFRHVLCAVVLCAISVGGHALAENSSTVGNSSDPTFVENAASFTPPAAAPLDSVAALDSVSAQDAAAGAGLTPFGLFTAWLGIVCAAVSLAAY